MELALTGDLQTALPAHHSKLSLTGWINMYFAWRAVSDFQWILIFYSGKPSHAVLCTLLCLSFILNLSVAMVYTLHLICGNHLLCSS